VNGRVTNGLRIGWSPSLAYHERRLEVLRALEDAGVLHEFFVGDDDTGARVGVEHHELRVGVRGIVAVLFPPEEAARPVIEAVRHALELVEPKELRSISVFTQHLLAVEQPYEEARRVFTSAMLGGVARLTAAVDSAVLLDGQWAQGPMQLEVGIVSRSELEQRLLGGVGRAHPPRNVMGNRKLPDGLPAVSLYTEANRVLADADSLTAGDRPAKVLMTWTAAAEESDELARGLATELASVLRFATVEEHR
jgi:hypothetical protein